jgi:uncharacterized protein YfcZ (UPF0381/DUF406 family)
MANEALTAAKNRVRGAQGRLEASERRLERARLAAERLKGDVGVSREDRIGTVVAVEDCATEVARLQADVAEAQAKVARLEDLRQALKLERLEMQLWQNALGIDMAMVALRQAFEAHRQVMLEVAELSPAMGRAVTYPFLRRLPQRGACQAHGLQVHLQTERVMAAAARGFAEVAHPALAAEIAKLRGGQEPDATETEAA